MDHLEGSRGRQVILLPPAVKLKVEWRREKKRGERHNSEFFSSSFPFSGAQGQGGSTEQGVFQVILPPPHASFLPRALSEQQQQQPRLQKRSSSSHDSTDDDVLPPPAPE